MNKDQLIALIRETSGPIVAEAVEHAVKAQVDPLRAQNADIFRQVLGAAGRPAELVAVPHDQKGLALARCIRATAAAKMRGSGVDGAIDILRKWGDTELAEKWGEARQKFVKVFPNEYKRALSEMHEREVAEASTGNNAVAAVHDSVASA